MTEIELRNAMHQYQDMVYRIAWNYTKNTADAQDISQEAFLRLYRYDTVFSEEEQQRAWLIRVTINLCKNTIRNRWRAIIPQKWNPSVMPAVQVSAFADSTSVTEKMLQLPKQDRLILHLYYYEEYCTEEISRILQIKEDAVRKRLSRARKRLEKRLKEETFAYEELSMDSPISK